MKGGKGDTRCVGMYRWARREGRAERAALDAMLGAKVFLEGVGEQHLRARGGWVE